MGFVRVLRNHGALDVRRLAADFAHLPLHEPNRRHLHLSPRPRRRGATTTFVQLPALTSGRPRFHALPPGPDALHPHDPQAIGYLLATYSKLSGTPDDAFVQLSIERRDAPSMAGVLLHAIGGPARPLYDPLLVALKASAGPADCLMLPAAQPETVAVLCVARENVSGGTLHFSSRHSNLSETADLAPGDLCLFDADVQVIKGPLRQWDVDFDGWEDFVVLRTRHAS
jgi:hypothetical protein